MAPTRARFSIVAGVAAVWLCLCTAVCVEAQDGLYARLQTTMGEIRCQLYFEQVPRTVANFVSLAEGTRPWVDYPAGRPAIGRFYDGLTFHRVMTNFMIQSGSRNGWGTDGPGYVFKDEFVPGLTHSNAGVVSMANAGTNTNGSQFFITVAPTPWLDHVHTVFGHVVSGLEVAVAISGVTAVSNRPVVAVVITNVIVERMGAAAVAFDPLQVSPRLPEVRTIAPEMSYVGGIPAVYWPTRTNGSYMLFANTTPGGDGPWTLWLNGGWGGRYIDDLVTQNPRLFFRTTEIEYHE